MGEELDCKKPEPMAARSIRTNVLKGHDTGEKILFPKGSTLARGKRRGNTLRSLPPAEKGGGGGRGPRHMGLRGASSNFPPGNRGDLLEGGG